MKAFDGTVCLGGERVLFGQNYNTQRIQFSFGFHSAEEATSDQHKDSYLQSVQSFAILQDKLREYEDSITCNICLENRRDVAFLCGHGTCSECARSLEICPMCRKTIVQKVTLYSWRHCDVTSSYVVLAGRGLEVQWKLASRLQTKTCTLVTLGDPNV